MRRILLIIARRNLDCSTKFVNTKIRVRCSVSRLGDNVTYDKEEMCQVVNDRLLSVLCGT